MGSTDLPDEQRDAWLLAELRKALSNLAASPDEQIAHVESLGVGYDELALEFDDVVGAVIGYELVPESGVGALHAVKAALSSISGEGKAALWTDAGLRSRSEWSRIRQLARDALAEIGESRRG